MKQVDTEVEEGAVIWKAVSVITLLSCHEDTTYREKETEKGQKKRENKFKCVK